MDSAECKVGILLGIALPKMNGDTHSTLLMVSWRLMIFLFWKNSGVFLLIQTLCQPGFLQRFHSHILAPALPVLVNHSRCQQSQSKCRKDNYLVDDTTLCPLTVINFSCISTRLVAEAHENTVCKHWTLKHWEDIFVNCHEVPFTCSNAGMFQNLYFSLCALFQGAEGRNYDDVSKIIIYLHQNFVSSSSQSQMLEMKVQVQIIVRCWIVCTAARFL